MCFIIYQFLNSNLVSTDLILHNVYIYAHVLSGQTIQVKYWCYGEYQLDDKFQHLVNNTMCHTMLGVLKYIFNNIKKVIRFLSRIHL